ncbi:MAG: glycosyltransferase [Gemmatimonadaceae bacterium]
MSHVPPAGATVIIVPTYNERDNAPRMVAAIFALQLDADVLFVEDASPDGTGDVLEALRAVHSRLQVLHRSGKLGIGSAHLDGIAWARARGYQRVVTLDCDFSHNPEDIPRFLVASDDADVVVGSRWAARDSLPGWNILRRALTNIGHVLTRLVLGLPCDATGAFRVYRLDRLPPALFELVQSRSYAFFFESLFILYKNACRITEIPIVLPARTYGHSKMTLQAALHSVRIMLGIAARYRRSPGAFHPPAPAAVIDPKLVDPQDWAPYWQRVQEPSRRVYSLIASLYRWLFIRPRLHRTLSREFDRGAELLHAGCGGGAVDVGLHERLRISALDISPAALALYQRQNPGATRVLHGNILALSFASDSFDGYYSLGVIEHFVEAEIDRILAEACRVLRSHGKVVLFWPHAKATSVFVLRGVHRVLRQSGSQVQLHPPEVSLIASREMAERYLARAGFRITRYEFGAVDLWIQAVVVAEKRGS